MVSERILYGMEPEECGETIPSREGDMPRGYEAHHSDFYEGPAIRVDVGKDARSLGDRGLSRAISLSLGI